jgi:hypothetical protein
MPNNDGKNLSVSSGVSEETSLEPKNVAGRFSELHAARSEILERARDMAGLTIPSIFPHNSAQETEELSTPYQSVGARTVNNLANKLLLTLFPVSSPFFKLEVPEAILQQLQDEGNTGVKTQVESKLLEMENIIQSDMEVNAFRTKIFEALRSLVVVGNFLLNIPKEGEPIGYRMDQYVVKRSVKGTVLEIIVKEYVSRVELKPEWLEQLQKAQSYLDDPDGADVPQTDAKKLEMYTRVHLDGKLYHEAKYINGVMLKGTEAKYPKDASAWLALRWNALSGEDYGRSYVEEYLGDFRSLEGLSEAILKHSAITSKTIGIIRPNSAMQPQDLARVQNGGFITGDPEDLVFPEIGKYNDMQVAQTTVGNITESLSRAFLLTQTRDAERVTAEEIRLQASELETALGGAYSLLAVTFQQPILMREIDRLKKSKALQDVSNKDIEPRVIVGLEGLGRGTDLDKLLRAGAAMQQLAPLSQFMSDLDLNKLTQFIFNAVGLDGDDVLKSPEQKQAEQQQMQQQQMQEMSQGMMQEVVSKGTAPMINNAVENPEATMNVVQAAQAAMQPQ